ncbi:MAG: HAMP domain-containing protein [Bacillota bacterium]|nr:HAMP domain-containing protein [Bacillota bacterium]
MILKTATRWTSGKIIVPLNNIVLGLNKMTKEDFCTRIDFKAENEFAEIKNSFNFMAERLEESLKERKQLENLRQQLLVDISHDLKTPVISIQGYSRALFDVVVKDDDKKQKIS